MAYDGAHYKIGIGSLDSPEVRTLAEADVNTRPLYAQGHLLFARGGTLMAQSFDTKRLALDGGAVPVAEQAGGFSASDNGMLIYSGRSATPFQLTWFDRAGKRVGELGEPFIADTRMELSPDRKNLAMNAPDPASGNLDIWIFDVPTATPRGAFTASGRTARAPKNCCTRTLVTSTP